MSQQTFLKLYDKLKLDQPFIDLHHFCRDYIEAIDPKELMTYRVADLIDLLCIVNTKLFVIIDTIQESQPGVNDAEIAESARNIQRLNLQRSQIRNAIESKLDTGTTEEVKL